MKKLYTYLCVFSFILFSCVKEKKTLFSENIKDLKKKELIFDNINKSWNFNAKPSNTTSQVLKSQWKEWQIFLAELALKPKTSIGAFQLKSKNLSKKAADLLLNIPPQFNVQAINSRIVVLQTKINMLELYINLIQIPDAKVANLISEINVEVSALQLQMEEIMVKSKIKIEEGEQDLMMMLDTARAVPNVPSNVPSNVLPVQ
jgi:hypothetical protein